MSLALSALPLLVGSKILGLSPLQRSGVLVFHRIGSPILGTQLRSQYHSLKELRDILSFLISGGWTSLPLENFNNQPRCFSLTLDDGYLRNLEPTLSLLDEFHVVATQFLVASEIGGKSRWDQHKGGEESLMDEPAVRGWIAAGHRVGAHSCTHPNLRKLDEASGRREVADSRHILEDLLQIPILNFAYPYGSAGKREQGWVQEAGFSAGWILREGALENANPLARPRVAIRTLAMCFHHMFSHGR